MPASCVLNNSSCKRGIVQFGVRVGEFHPFDEQLKPLGNGRVVLLPLG